MVQVIVGKFNIDELELKPVIIKERSHSETKFCMKCGLNNNLIVTGTGTLCGCCGTELTWS